MSRALPERLALAFSTSHPRHAQSLMFGSLPLAVTSLTHPIVPLLVDAGSGGGYAPGTSGPAGAGASSSGGVSASPALGARAKSVATVPLVRDPGRSIVKCFSRGVRGLVWSDTMANVEGLIAWGGLQLVVVRSDGTMRAVGRR